MRERAKEDDLGNIKVESQLGHKTISPFDEDKKQEVIS